MQGKPENKFQRLDGSSGLYRFGLAPRKIVQAIERNIAGQRDRWFLWYPIAIILGVAFYFALPREPHILVFATATIIALLCTGALLRQRSSFKFFLTFCLLIGFVAAKVRTETVQPKTLRATTPTIEISGWVERLEAKNGRRSRLLLHLESAKGIKPEAMPELVRLSGRSSATGLFYGDRVSLKARLFPLPGPTKPRGYDFGRRLWFEGVGATGFYYGTIKKTGTVQPGTFVIKREIQKLRHLIGYRISQALQGRSAAIATALITGDRGKMLKSDVENLRKAGLAHILAISGLHMSLVAGGMFWLIRALLAMSGPLVLNYPIKKWAAIAGLLAGAFYLTISGASIATQRAFIMVLIMFSAILLERPAISLRNLAIAALIIVLARPEAVLSVGFQMSFMAVTGLIGFYELVRLWRHKHGYWLHEAGRIVRGFTKGISFFGAIGTTTLVASIYTGLPAAYHFNTIAAFSLAGNIVALPVVTLIVMPSAILTIVLMPFGLEFIGATMMEFGINLVLVHAENVAGLPNAQIFTPDLRTSSVLLVAGGMIWACLWRSWFKVLAVAPVVIGLLTIVDIRQPDILISKFGRNVALRNGQGLLVLADKKQSRFAVKSWLVSNGEGVSLKHAAARTGWYCENKLCTATVASVTDNENSLNQKIAYLKRGAKPTDRFCQGLNIIISAEPLGGICKSVAIRIDRFDLWRHGAHAIYLAGQKSNTKSKVETATSVRGQRPWVITPIARRKILINPQLHRRYRDKLKNPIKKQRAAFLWRDQ